MEVKVYCNTDEKTIFENVRANSRLPVPWIEIQPAHDKHAVIVGGGPSLADHIEEIKWRQSLGQEIFALNNVARYLSTFGILSDYQVILDARESNADFVGFSRHYLIASQVHPSTAKKAIESGVTSIWHPLIPGLGRYLPRDRWDSIAGGTTVGLCATCLAWAMGYRKLHLYGYDSCFKDGASHAYEQNQSGKENLPIVSWVMGKKYVSPITMSKQAELWPELAATLAADGCDITVHGEGLFQAVTRRMELGEPEVGTLNAVYDFAVSPASYDILSFLCSAEEARKKFGFKDIHVTFQPGSKDGFRADNLPPGSEGRRQHLYNVCLPACRLIPTIKGVTLLHERKDVQEPVFPQTWTVDKPVSNYGCHLVKTLPRVLRATDNSRVDIRKKFPGDYVTFTIRQAEYWPERNSNIPEWKKAGEAIERMGYPVVWVPDVNSDMDGFDAKDIDYRMALYEQAKCNLLVVNGPIDLLRLSNAPYLMFKPITNSAPATTIEFLNRNGIEFGDQFGPNGVTVWEDDTAEVIIREFKNFMDGKRPAPLNNSPQVMLEQAEKGLKRPVQMFLGGAAHNGTALIVGGGPSLKETLPKIHYYKNKGAQIFAVNGTHDWLIERGIKPDFHVLLDSRKENARFLKNPIKSCIYLLAAQCHESLYEALNGYHVEQYVAYATGIEKLADKFPEKPICVIGGGSTVGLKAMILAFMKGYRKIHLFGMDSCYRGDENHAYRQPENDGENVIDVEYNGKYFKAASWMARQAEDFPEQYGNLFNQGCRIQVHGDGLLKTILDDLTQTKEAA